MLLKLHKFGKLKKSSDATKTTTCHTNEMSTIVQQFTSNDTLIPTPNFLYTKDEIIKKLVETQITVLNTISAKSNSQHSNTLNQCSSFLPSNSPNENSPNKKQLASQEQQDPAIGRPCSSQLQEISHPIQMRHQRSEQNITMESIYGAIYWKISPNQIFVNILT